MDITLAKADLKSLERLISDLQSKRFLGFCGAGTSAPLGYPTWHELMLEFSDALEDSTRSAVPPDVRITIEAKRASLPYFAKWIKQRMPSGAYEEFLQSIFRPRTTADFSVEHDLLVRLPIKQWVTTNYDLCLNEALRAYLNRNISISDAIPFADIGRAAGGPLASIVHLHGAITNPDRIVLTADDYVQRYRRAADLSHALRGLGTLSILFVGYGINDHDFNSCLESTTAILGGLASDHFALLPREPAVTPFELELKSSELRDRGVHPIFYPVQSNDHSARREIIRSILQELKIAPPLEPIQLTIYWTTPEATARQVREQLRKLCERVPQVPVCLRASQAHAHSVTLSFNTSQQMAAFQNILRDSDYWSETMPSEARRASAKAATEAAFVNLTQRDGKRFRIDEVRLPQHTTVSREDFVPTQGDEAAKVGTSAASTERFRQMSHALALGILTPEYRHHREILNRLMPSIPAYNLSDCFHPTLDWRLDSPIIHAWLYYDEDGPIPMAKKCVAVTLVGEGLPHVRQELETAAFIASLSLSGAEGNIINRGVIHLSAIDAKDEYGKPTGIFQKMLGLAGSTQLSIPIIPEDSREVLNGFAAMIRRLAHETGFISVHAASFSDFSKVRGILVAQMAQFKTGSSVRLLAPKEHGTGRVLVHFPYPQFPKPLVKPKIELELSAELVKSPEMKKLLDAYYRAVITKISADLERRIEFYTQELERDRELVRWFNSLSPEEQRNEPDVRTGRTIDKELGIDIATEQQTVPAKIYYTHVIPTQHIPDEEKELERLQASREPIKALQTKEHPPIWRQCLARLFDCAIRQSHFSDDPGLNELFDAWRALIDGMLQLEWERCLTKIGVPMTEVFKHTTFFDLTFDEDKNVLRIFPVALVDSHRSVFVVDGARATMIVLDPIDTAVSKLIEHQSSGGYDEILGSLLETDQKERIVAVLREQAFQESAFAKRICESAIAEGSLPAVSENDRKEILRRAQGATTAARYFQLNSVRAFNTALEILQPENEANPSPSKALCLAIVECRRAGYNPRETLTQLYQKKPVPLPFKIVARFQRALAGDPAMVERYLQGYGPGVGRVELLPHEQLAWAIEEMLEAACIAHKFRASLGSFNPAGETLASAFFKTEEALEAAHTALFGSVSPSLVRIQKTLSGEPIQSTGK